MAELSETYACAPSTERGRGILISGDPKSDSITYCNGRAVIIRRLGDPMDVWIYGEHAHPTTVARFSPNGEWIASADISGTVRIWGRHGDRVLKNEFRVLSGRIDDLQWSPDSQRIVASGDGKGKSFVRAFMWDSGTNIGEFDGHSKRVLSCDFKPTRPFRIVTVGEDFILNFYEGPPFKFKHSNRDHSNFVNCVRYSPDGSKFITVSSDKKGIIFDGKSGDKIGELSAHDGHKGSIYAVSWSPDSRKVLTVSADKTAKVWDITEGGEGRVNLTLACPGSGGVDDMQVGCLWHGDHLVTVSLGGVMSIFSASDPGKPPTCIAGHMRSINALACLHQQNGQRLFLTASYDGVIMRWVPGTGYAGHMRTRENTLIKCFSATEAELLAAGFDSKVRRLPINEEGQCGDAEAVDVGSQPNSVHLVSKRPELAIVCTDSRIVLLRGAEVASAMNLGYVATASAVSPDGKEVIVGGQDGKLRLYFVNHEGFEEAAVLEKHRGAVTAVQYSHDAAMFASTDANREAIVWDRASQQVKVKNMVYHSARINCVAWSPDDRLVATGSLDTCVIVYWVDKPASTRITIKGAHMGGVCGLTFVTDNCIVSAGDDACVRLWTLPQPPPC